MFLNSFLYQFTGSFWNPMYLPKSSFRLNKLLVAFQVLILGAERGMYIPWNKVVFFFLSISTSWNFMSTNWII
jgi:hypothetical protein